MDGNGRWAAARALPRPAGHRMGVRSVKQIVENCAQARRRSADAVRVLERELEAADATKCRC